jgi:hypothetical protein
MNKLPKRKFKVIHRVKHPSEAVRLEKMYFTAATQDAIVRYQQEQNQKVRHEIYLKEIFPAFSKLVENLININKFSGLHESYDDLKNDCIAFLFETIRKFDQSRGSNAFSYFNVVAKNWLIVRSKQRALYTKKIVSMDDTEALTMNEKKFISDQAIVPSQDEEYDKASASLDNIKMLHDIRTCAKTENELSCINSIITIFERINDIDILNKNALLMYMRELSGLSPKQLTTMMQSIRRYYRVIKDERDR